MSFFKGKNSNFPDTARRAITVSAETRATVSDRVDFKTQIVKFDADTESDLIELISVANTEDSSRRTTKGLILVFDKNIASSTYSVGDPDFPFKTSDYYETATIPGFTTSFSYNPVSGTFTVDTITVTSDKLLYQIDFNFKGVNSHTNEELEIIGSSTYLIFMRPM